MQCSFCHQKINRFLYACDQHPQVTACEGCRDYTCNRCRVALSPVPMEFCTGCQSYQEASRMFGKKYESFCYDCCLQAYKQNAKGKKVILRNHICEPDKFDVYCFLKKFCCQCRKNMEKERPQGIDSGLREIYPLETNLCGGCSSLGSPSVQSQNLSKSRSTKSFNQFSQQSSTNVHDSSSNLSTSRSKQANSYIYEPKQSKRASPSPTPTFSASTGSSNMEFAKQSPVQKWKRIQNVTNQKFLRCLVCGHLMLDDGLIDDEILLCSYCTRRSQASEQLINQENVRRSRRKQQQQQVYSNTNSRSKAQNKDFDFYDPYKTRQSKQTFKNEQTRTTITNTLSPKAKQTQPQQTREYAVLSRTENQSSRDSKATKNNLHLKNLGSDGFLERVALNIQYPVDSELISCDKCGVQIEISALLWEEKENVPLCRYCFADTIDKAKELKDRYERYSNNYTSQPQTKQSGRVQDRKQQIQSPIQAKQSMMQTSNTRKQSKSPDIIEYSPQKSYDKRTTNPSPKNSPQQQQQAVNSKVGKIVQNVSTNISNRTSPVSYAEMKKASQPEIMQDKPSNRVRKSDSWDESILMEPVEDHERRKRNQQQSEKNKIPEQNQYEIQNDVQQQKLKKQQLNEAVITEDDIKPNIKSSNQNDKKTAQVKQTTRLQSQPTIVEQSEQRSRRVKKLQSWNDQIILEPLADHLERKKQQQSNSENTQVKQADSRNINDQKPKTKQASKHLENQAGVKSPQRLPKIDERNEKKKYQKIPEKKKETYDDHGYTQRNSEQQNYRRSEMQKLIQLQRQMHELKQKQTASKRRHVTRQYIDDYYDPYFEMEKQYSNLRRRIQENIADSQNRWRNIDDNRKADEIFNRAKKQSYDRYYRHQQTENAQKLADSRSRYTSRPQTTQRVYAQPTFTYKSPGYISPKASERSTNLSNSRQTSTKTRQQSYYGPMAGSRAQTMKSSRDNFDHYDQQPRREGFTGFRVLEQKVRKMCSLCQNTYITTYKDYYAAGSNVCLDCYGQYNRRNRL